MPEELREQVPLMKEALQTMNIPILTMEGYEADDILGTVAKRCQAEGNRSICCFRRPGSFAVSGYPH